MSERVIRRVQLIKGGTIIKQGETFTLGFRLFDANDRIIQLESADVVTVKIANRTGVIKEVTASKVDDYIEFTVNESIGYGEMRVELTVTNGASVQKYPARDWIQLTITQSLDDAGAGGIQATTATEMFSRINVAETKATTAETKALAAETTATNVQRDFDQILTEAGDSNPEIVAARLGEENLRVFNEKVTTQLAETVKKGEGGSVSWAMADQNFRENVTGGSTAVVGIDAVLKENIVDGAVTTKKTNFIAKETSVNAFDKAKVSTGFYLNAANGAQVVNAGYFTSDYMEGKKNDVIRYPYDATLGAGSVVFMYDVQGNYLGNVSGTLDVGNTHRAATLTHDNVDTFQISLSNSRLNTAMVTVNEPYPSSYVDYLLKHKLNETFTLNEKQKSEVEAIATNNPLSEKIVSGNGDSIMYGAGHLGGFLKIIADRNGMIYENKGVSGATITAETYNGGTARHWISRTISTMRSDADYAILEGSVNDSALGVPLGTMTPVNDYTAALDDTTYSGAFEKMLKELILRFKGKKFGFVITHKMNNAFAPYYARMIEILNKWGVDYCDLYKTVPPLFYINDLKTLYTKDADGWHPNEQGYLVFYVDKIEAWMKTL